MSGLPEIKVKDKIYIRHTKKFLRKSTTMERSKIPSKTTGSSKVNLRSTNLSAPKCGYTEYAQLLGLQPMPEFKFSNPSIANLPEQKFCARTEYARLLGLQPRSSFMCCNQGKYTSAPTVYKNNAEFKSREKPNMFIKTTAKFHLCCSCGVYYNTTDIVSHVKEIHNEYICLPCSETFVSPETLKKHVCNRLKNVHLENDTQCNHGPSKLPSTSSNPDVTIYPNLTSPAEGEVSKLSVHKKGKRSRENAFVASDTQSNHGNLPSTSRNLDVTINPNLTCPTESQVDKTSVHKKAKRTSNKKIVVKDKQTSYGYLPSTSSNLEAINPNWTCSSEAKKIRKKSVSKKVSGKVSVTSVNKKGKRRSKIRRHTLNDLLASVKPKLSVPIPPPPNVVFPPEF